MTTELIVYACPLGDLQRQLAAYATESLTRYGHNSAHDYMPHVTLTGFFHDTITSIPFYAAALEAALQEAAATRPESPLVVTGLMTTSEFIGLMIESVWVKRLTTNFAMRAEHSPTRSDPIRCKDWLHLSLAYGFPLDSYEGLATLAHDLVDPMAAGAWELRLYEHQPGNQWLLHAAWPL
ncbi:MAG: hypothetical protein Fur005_32230 [Roseiflexaceae bacterium]